MKIAILSIFLFSTVLHAQTVLNFNKHFVESEDKWVAFQKDKDDDYSYGFIYIDEQAGLTIQYEGTFKINQEGVFVPKKIDSSVFKMRLEPNNVLVAFIPENKFQELKISAIPEWLHFYKTDSNSVQRLYKWGFLYNGWEQCAKALTYLERAQKIDSMYNGLAVEMAYSYNCLGRYEDAITALKRALHQDSTSAYVNKELIYAQIKSGQLDKASQSCRNALAICKDTTFNGENCYNLLYEYYLKKDKANFDAWLSEAKKWNSKEEKLMKSIATMEMAINQ